MLLSKIVLVSIFTLGIESNLSFIHLQLEKALTENQTKIDKTRQDKISIPISVDEPLDEADCSFLRSIYVTAYPKNRKVDLHRIEMEKIQGYAIVFKLLAGETKC